MASGCLLALVYTIYVPCLVHCLLSCPSFSFDWTAEHQLPTGTEHTWHSQQVLVPNTSFQAKPVQEASCLQLWLWPSVNSRQPAVAFNLRRSLHSTHSLRATLSPLPTATSQPSSDTPDANGPCGYYAARACLPHKAAVPAQLQRQASEHCTSHQQTAFKAQHAMLHLSDDSRAWCTSAAASLNPGCDPR